MSARTAPYHAVVTSPVGMLGIVADDALVCIDFLDPKAPARRPATPLARDVATQLTAYFQDPAFAFTLPLSLAGTAYQQRVWRAMRRIPTGKVLSYGDLAARIHSGPRAVGGACRANPVPIIVPCHRVVASTGVGGYTGGRVPGAIHIKQWLLQHEAG